MPDHLTDEERRLIAEYVEQHGVDRVPAGVGGGAREKSLGNLLWVARLSAQRAKRDAARRITRRLGA